MIVSLCAPLYGGKGKKSNTNSVCLWYDEGGRRAGKWSAKSGGPAARTVRKEETMIFERPGEENTAAALQCALEAAKEKEIKYLVFSSNRGESVKKLLEIGVPEGLKVTVVTSTFGFKAPNEWQFGEEMRTLALEAGFNVCTAAHALSGAERSFSNKFSGAYPVEIVAHTLRMFGAGTKVAVECALMAADAGYIPVGEPVIAMGGTGRGLDTAWILKAANTHTLLATRLEECLCKPLV